MLIKNANIYFQNLLVPVYLVKKLYQLVPAYTEDDNVVGKLNLFQYVQKDGTSINLPTYEEVFEWFRNRGFYFDIRYNFDNEISSDSDETNWYFYELWIDDGDEGIIEKKWFKSYKQTREHLLNRIVETCGEKYGNSLPKLYDI